MTVLPFWVQDNLCSLCFSLKCKDYVFHTSYQVKPPHPHSTPCLPGDPATPHLCTDLPSIQPTLPSLQSHPFHSQPTLSNHGNIPINPCGSLFLFLVSPGKKKKKKSPNFKTEYQHNKIYLHYFLYTKQPVDSKQKVIWGVNLGSLLEVSIFPTCCCSVTQLCLDLTLTP